jgi:hypothetical protein
LGIEQLSLSQRDSWAITFRATANCPISLRH